MFLEKLSTDIRLMIYEILLVQPILGEWAAFGDHDAPTWYGLSHQFCKSAGPSNSRQYPSFMVRILSQCMGCRLGTSLDTIL